MKKQLLKTIILTVLISSSICSMASAEWHEKVNGKWTWIQDSKNTIGWKNIDDKWYYFDGNGEMRTGWLYDNGKWYCMADDGHMFVGWICYSDKWYFMNHDGDMRTGWFRQDDKDYYLGDDGARQTGTISMDGKIYNFSEKGVFLSVEDNYGEENNEYVIKDPIINSTNVNDSTIFEGTNENYTIAEDNTKVNENSNEHEDLEYENDDLSYDDIDDLDYEDDDDDLDYEDDDDDLDYEDSKNNEELLYGDLEDESLPKKLIRTEEPEKNNKYYYSNSNLYYKYKLSPPFYSNDREIDGNCTWYAWGRIFELTGEAPDDAGFNGNAYEWWDANKKNGKFKYGNKPKVGALAVWKPTLPNSGGCGHVAVVEKIEDNKIYISESFWHGSTFDYKEIYETGDLYGYIYID